MLRLAGRTEPPKPVDLVRFSDPDVRAVIEGLPEGQLLVGLDEHRQPCVLDLNDRDPHAGFYIPAGHGDTTLARSLLAQHLHQGGVGMVLCVKPLSHMWCFGHPRMLLASTFDQINDELRWLGQEMDHRRQLLGNNDALTDLPRVLVIAEKDRHVLARDARRVLLEATCLGRQSKVHVVQFGDYFLGGINVGFRGLGPASVQVWRRLAPEVERDGKFPLSSRQRGSINVVQLGQVRRVQTMWITPEDAHQWAGDE